MSGTGAINQPPKPPASSPITQTIYQLGAVAKGAAPDLSKIPDTDVKTALVLLLVQQRQLVGQYMAGVSQDQLTLADVTNQIKTTLASANKIVDDQSAAVYDTLKNTPPPNPDPDAYDISNPPPYPGEWRQMSYDAYQDFTTKIKGYEALKDKPDYVMMKDTEGRLFEMSKANWDGQKTHVSTSSNPSDPNNIVYKWRNVNITKANWDNPVGMLFYEGDFKKIVADTADTKLSSPYYSKGLADPTLLKGLADLGLEFPPASTDPAGMRKLISSVSNKQSSINQDIMDTGREVTKVQNYMSLMIQEASQILSEDVGVANNAIRNFAF